MNTNSEDCSVHDKAEKGAKMGKRRGIQQIQEDNEVTGKK